MRDIFLQDLEVGKIHEQIILKKIKLKYSKAYIEDGYCKEWDIYIPELKIGVEVKSDQKSMHTGNIVIEIEFDNKASALSTTKAKFWVIYDGIEYHWFDVSDINKCINENNLRPTNFTGRGDNKEKKAYLIKKELLYQYETRRHS